MSQQQVSPENYWRVVRAYNWLPGVTILALLGSFFAVYFFTESVLWSSVVAAVPSVLLLWRWVLAGRQIDRWGCPKCGEPFPKRMTWTYPPSVCPRCGERLDK